MRNYRKAVLAAGVALGVASAALGTSARASSIDRHEPETPIKHLVVIFGENVSFDHYFGTYPKAANTSGQTFVAARRTPGVNGLSKSLLTANPNGVNPRRYDPSTVNDLVTCDEDHVYKDEQTAFDNGKMDKFVSSVGTGTGKSGTGQPCSAADVMNYYDGNTVTGLWNYAQKFAMSDNSYGTTFGPSSPGAINLVSGNTGTVDASSFTLAHPPAAGDVAPDGKGGWSMISDPQPAYDDCSNRDSVAMKGTNIGDELNAAHLSWGFFQGGFAPTTGYDAATGSAAVCGATHNVGAALGGTGKTGVSAWGTKGDYIPHHEPFQYYASTANPHHLPPTSDAAIGTSDQANHQYDMSDFDRLVSDIGAGTLSPGHLPAVSYLKAPGYQDGHAGYSDPIDEQQFVVKEINALEKLPTWKSTAVVLAYDDSDGWYDHAYSGVTNASTGAFDSLTGNGLCGDPVALTPLAGQAGRCGYGPRLPLLVVSPWAKRNAVDHTLTDQSSILRFVEDNWSLARIPGSFDALAGSFKRLFDFHQHGAPRTLILDPATGQPTS